MNRCRRSAWTLAWLGCCGLLGACLTAAFSPRAAVAQAEKSAVEPDQAEPRASAAEAESPAGTEHGLITTDPETTSKAGASGTAPGASGSDLGASGTADDASGQPHAHNLDGSHPADGTGGTPGSAHPTADTHAAAAPAPGNPLAFKTDLAIWTLVVFVLLSAVLFKFAWGPIAEGLDKREAGIASNIESAQRTHDDARRLLADYETRLAKAHDEVRGILEEARRDAEHTQQQILAKARTDAEAEVARGRREIENATNVALTELAKTSANLAVDLAGKIVRAQLNPADHARLIEEAVASFPHGDPRRN